MGEFLQIQPTNQLPNDPLLTLLALNVHHDSQNKREVPTAQQSAQAFM